MGEDGALPSHCRELKRRRRGALDEMLWYRLYQYDPAGNRTRVDWFDGTVMRSSTYAYSALNQLTSLLGAAQGERHDVQYDANGNHVNYALDHKADEEVGYSWTIDDRLASASTLESGNPISTVSYVYDASGARILRRAPDGTRQRYFFHGLTEEVTKQSVAGVASDAAFGMVERCTGALVPSQWYAPAGTLTSVHDTARRSQVIRLAAGSYAHHGRDYRGGGAAYWPAPILWSRRFDSFPLPGFCLLSVYHRRGCGIVGNSARVVQGL